MPSASWRGRSSSTDRRQRTARAVNNRPRRRPHWKDETMGKTDGAQKSAGATPLENVPVFLTDPIELDDGTAYRAGETAWLPRDVAKRCERSRLGQILAACSVSQR